MPQRDFDVVLYGASGFTGKQTVEYFAAHAGNIRWAIAGRNRAKLEAVKSHLGESVKNIEVLVADSEDQSAIDAIVSRTRVLLTTAGPFALYGTKIVDACVRFKTHYVDITGETVWVKNLIDKYHAQAAQDGTRIIPFCGFDSIPSDLGAFMVARYIQRNLGVACKQVKAYFQMAGGVNGGTLATAFNQFEGGYVKQAQNPFLLNPETSKQNLNQHQDPASPHYDSDLGAWVGSFIMGQINTRVVRRSSALFAQWEEDYGADFSYQEYSKFNGALGWMPAAGLSVGTSIFELMMASPLRPMLKSMLPKPGDGPSEKTMNEGWFRCELIGIAEDGRKVRGIIKDKGDPGNRATVKFLCESVLSLAVNTDELPGGNERGGILTPATGMGEVLVRRLKTQGMVLDVEN